MRFANFILQKIAETPVFNDFHVKPSSPHSRVHLLPTSSSKSAPGIRVFYDFYVKSSSLPTSSSKRRPNASVFYNCYLKSSSRLSLVHFLSTTFADRGPHKQKQRPYFGDHGSHFTRKNTGFRYRESFQSWIHAFPTSYTSQLLDEDEDEDGD